MADHTPEPWPHLEWYMARRFRDARDFGGRTMFGVITPLSEDQERAAADGRRVRAAIAGCRGIPTEALERGVVRDLLATYRQIHDWVKACRAAEVPPELVEGSFIEERLRAIEAKLGSKADA